MNHRKSHQKSLKKTWAPICVTPLTLLTQKNFHSNCQTFPCRPEMSTVVRKSSYYLHLDQKRKAFEAKIILPGGGKGKVWKDELIYTEQWTTPPPPRKKWIDWKCAQVSVSTWRRCESAGGWPTPSSSWTAGRPRPYSSRQPPEMMWCFYRTGDQQHPYRMLTMYVQTLLLLAILTRTHTNVLVQLAMAFRRRKKYKMNSQSKNDARFVSCQILSYHWKNAWHRSYS